MRLITKFIVTFMLVLPAVCFSAAPDVDGACGSSDGQILDVAPSGGNLCNTGNASEVTGNGPWQWQCAGTGAGKTANCRADANGACGAANASIVDVKPSGAGLCKTGIPGKVIGDGPWQWSCGGSGKGTTASCVAILKASSTTAVEDAESLSNGIVAPQVVYFPVRVCRFKKVISFASNGKPILENADLPKYYCAPVGALGDVTKKIDNNFIVTFHQPGGFRDLLSTVTFSWVSGTDIYSSDKNPKCVPENSNDFACVNTLDTYDISSNDANGFEHLTDGYMAGVLAIPLKYHPGSRATTSGSSIGGFIGKYESTFQISYAIIFSAGLAFIDTQTSSTASTASSNTQTGVTVATGLVGQVANSNAQFGIVWGVDYLGRDSGYKYNGHPWLAFEVGYNFLRKSK